MMNISLNQIRKIQEDFGNPIYIFDEKSFIENYRQFEEVFRKYYINYQISYSYKTNYTPYICSLIKRLGGYAEVVSEMERSIAKQIGHRPSEIIYNGPNKGNDGLKAILEGSIVNIDNLDELNSVFEAAKEHKTQKLRIGLRVNLNIGQDFVSRFGMDEEDLTKAFRLVKEIPNLSIVGLHCHISRCRGLEAWRRRTELMLSYADKFFIHRPPEYLDLGSGMFGQMDYEFAEQFADVPTYIQYAEVTAKVIGEHYKGFSNQQKPVFFTEPGTTLINKYIDFLGRIDAIKTVRGKSFAVLNLSMHNLGEVCALKKLPLKIVDGYAARKEYEKIDLVGYTCLEQDVVYSDFCGMLGEGDFVHFGNVGGYSNVYKPPFIWPNCPMVAKTENEELILIKRAETYDDILQTYVF